MYSRKKFQETKVTATTTDTNIRQSSLNNLKKMYKDVQYSPLQATPTSGIISHHSKQSWPKMFFIVLVSFCCLSLVYINFVSVGDVNLTVSSHEEALCFPTEKS